MEIIKRVLTYLFSLLHKLIFPNKTVILLGNPYGNVSGHIKCCYDLLKLDNSNNVYIINNNSHESNNEITRFSLKTFILLLKSKTIIYTHSPTTDIFPIIPCDIKKINIWHGMPIKSIGYDSNIEKVWINNKSKNNLSPYLVNDLLIVSSKYWVNYFSKAWKFPKNKILPLGSIVSAYLQKNKDTITNQLMSVYSSKHKYIIFAPTFRNDKSDNDYINKTLSLFSKLAQYNFIIKLHPKLNLTFEKKYKNILFSSQFDLFELFMIADLLITDYSSVFYEYLNLKSKCILYQPDRLEYERLNGQLNPIEKGLTLFYSTNELELEAQINYLMNKDNKSENSKNTIFDIKRFINIINQ